MDRTESRFFAKMSGWDYSASKVELMLANIIDLITLINTDPKQRHKFKPFHRPFKVDVDKDSVIGSGAVMPLSEAIEAYKPTVQTKTAEEIIEANKQFMLKQQKEQNV